MLVGDRFGQRGCRHNLARYRAFGAVGHCLRRPALGLRAIFADGLATGRARCRLG